MIDEYNLKYVAHFRRFQKWDLQANLIPFSLIITNMFEKSLIVAERRICLAVARAQQLFLEFISFEVIPLLIYEFSVEPDSIFLLNRVLTFFNYRFKVLTFL